MQFLYPILLFHSRTLEPECRRTLHCARLRSAAGSQAECEVKTEDAWWKCPACRARRDDKSRTLRRQPSKSSVSESCPLFGLPDQFLKICLVVCSGVCVGLGGQHLAIGTWH